MSRVRRQVIPLRLVLDPASPILEPKHRFDLAAAERAVLEVLGPHGLCLLREWPQGATGFTYVTYFPVQHAHGAVPYLYAGSRQAHRSPVYFGSGSAIEGRPRLLELGGAVRFVVEATHGEGADLNVLEETLLARLGVKRDWRFFNEHERAFGPRTRQEGRERAAKARATIKHRRSKVSLFD